jgi:outer membrane protein, multidrug efflux system
MNLFSHLKIPGWRAAAPVIVLFVLVLAGCTMIPKYQQPQTSISPTWPNVPGYPTNQTAPAKVQAADIGWHDFFRDPRLQEVIQLALTNNPNLYVTIQNVAETHSLYRVQAAALIPTINLNANGQRERVPNVYTSGTNNSTPPPLTYTEYNINLGVASYELDLFGQIRSLKRQALETYLATQEAQKSAQIALVAQVAVAYVSEQEATVQLALARESLRAARQSFDLTKRSFEAGVMSQFDLNNASTQLSTASANVAAYAQQYAESVDTLNLLVGEPLPADLQPTRFNPKVCLSDIPNGLPSDLLERRPDIMEVEHQLKAANANIGAARAAFFPTITLTGNAGMASTTLQSLFAPGSHAWGFSPQIVWPIFDMGTAYNELQAVKAAQRIEVADYRNAVLNAFKEVADALATRITVQSQLVDGEALVKADQQSYDLTKAGFQSGVNSALDLLVTQQTLDSAQQSLIQAQYSRLMSLVNLYQALGGGWEEHTGESPEQQTAQK